MSVTLKGGVSYFVNSQSFALAHLIKPSIRLEGTYRIQPRLDLSVELVGVAASEGYRLIGGYFVAGFVLYNGDVFRMLLAAGGGLGTAPKILSPGLTTDAALAVWGQLGLRFRWEVVRDLLVLGVDTVSEQLSVVTVTGTVGVRF